MSDRLQPYQLYVKAVRGGKSSNNFINNGDGTIIDTDSGLMWQQDTPSGTYNWQQALAYCENLTLAGYDDWRLPNLNELQSLVDYSLHNPAIDKAYFPSTLSSEYWSSTTLVRSPDSAWYVNFIYGNVYSLGKSNSRYVRAVRGGQCGVSGDWDLDTICNDVDNCPSRPNGTPGTCVTIQAGMTVSYRAGNPKDYITCTNDNDCIPTGGTCQMEQEDCNDNGIGDVCECYANFNYPTDLKITGLDLNVYKLEYGRFDCLPSNPCYADGTKDGKVTGLDLILYKNEYGRIDCPALP